ncbi:MAG: transport-associated protein [Bryobacterales bacterium]|nr:transport-associated protein [Bryobacterales bacterium]
MKDFRKHVCLLALLGAGVLAGCSKTPSSDMATGIDNSLDRAGLVDVTVKQDAEKGVVTLGGHVPAEAQKAQAEQIAKSMANGQVVANQIEVITPGAEGEAKKVNEALDKGIESNLDAALVAERLKDDVKYAVKNHVVTLSGNVENPDTRDRAEQIAAGVPYVHQVVNELQVRKQKATSTR